MAALKGLTVHRYSVVIFTFADPLGMWGSTLICEQSSAQLGARRCEECGICHYLARMDRVCCFQALDAVFPKDPFLQIIDAKRQIRSK